MKVYKVNANNYNTLMIVGRGDGEKQHQFGMSG